MKLLDFEERWDELTVSENPFAVVIQAHLKTLRTRDRLVERKEWNLAILRGLYDRGWGRDEIRQVFRFIDGLMTLPKHLDDEFAIELETMEEENDMPYVSSVERVYMNRGLEKGRKEGRTEGELLMARKNILDALEVLFGDVPDAARTAIESVAITGQCTTLHRAAILADSMDAFEKKLAEVTADEEWPRVGGLIVAGQWDAAPQVFYSCRHQTGEPDFLALFYLGQASGHDLPHSCWTQPATVASPGTAYLMTFSIQPHASYVGGARARSRMLGMSAI